MRRRVFLLTALVFAFVLCGCGGNAGNTNGTDPTVYEILNGMKEADYTAVLLDVTTEYEGETLKGSYRCRTEGGKVSVTYSYERLSLFGEEGGGFTVPADRKTTYEGSATLSGGKVSSVTGDPLDLPAEMLSAETFDFSEENFTAVTERTGSFSAKVVRVEAFLGRAVTAEGMEVKVLYSSGRFTSMTVSYSANGAEILLSYRFE